MNANRKELLKELVGKKVNILMKGDRKLWHVFVVDYDALLLKIIYTIRNGKYIKYIPIYNILEIEEDRSGEEESIESVVI